MNTTKCQHCGAPKSGSGIYVIHFTCGTWHATPSNSWYRVDQCYERQIAALQAELAKRQWQPIETAPKNKQAICFSPAKHGRNSLAEWMRIQYLDETPFRIPTHWQPLPEPPKE